MVNLSPSTMTRRPYKFRLEVAASSMVNDENDGKSDHVEAMAADPVGCLFAQTNLAARIGWMLSPGPALRLPPDTVAHALPALLITAARHSAALALLVLPNRLYWVVFFFMRRDTQFWLLVGIILSLQSFNCPSSGHFSVPFSSKF